MQISAGVHFEGELLSLQMRAYDISIARERTEEELEEAADPVGEFFEEVRKMELKPSRKPSMLLVLHTMVFIVSYTSLRISLAT